MTPVEAMGGACVRIAKTKKTSGCEKRQERKGFWV
jgi:hypothetical protein